MKKKKNKPRRPNLHSNARLETTSVRLPKRILSDLKQYEGYNKLLRVWIVRGYKKWKDEM